MGNIVDFRNEQPEKKIKIPRSERFAEIANELSDFINALPLNQPDNDKLIQIIVEQIKESEHTAFLFGFDMGVKATKGT